MHAARNTIRGVVELASPGDMPVEQWAIERRSAEPTPSPPEDTLARLFARLGQGKEDEPTIQATDTLSPPIEYTTGRATSTMLAESEAEFVCADLAQIQSDLTAELSLLLARIQRARASRS